MTVLTATLPRSQPDQTNLFNLPGLGEVLLEHQDLARVGHLDTPSLIKAAERAREGGLRTVLVWDILCDDAAIAHGGSLLRQINPDLLDAVRTQDPGAAQYILDHFPQLPLHLVLETGNHNLIGIQTWVDVFKPERVVLSNELPLKTIAQIREAIDTPVEIMALGRLLVFYTPRKLISPIEPDTDEDDLLQRVISSEEDRKKFPLVENKHGTFMYYEKELFLLPYLDEIEKAGVAYARLDLKFYNPDQVLNPLANYLQSREKADLDTLRGVLGEKLTRGFFKSNRTDKQFKKLKNPHLDGQDRPSYLGSVMETARKKFMAVMVEASFKAGDTLVMVNPEGERLEHQVQWIRNLSGQKVATAQAPGVYTLNPGRKISSGTQIYARTELDKAID